MSRDAVAGVLANDPVMEGSCHSLEGVAWDESMIKGDTDKSYPSAHPLKESLLPIECLLGWLPLSENAGKTLNQY